jgi:hypothetical protein
MIPICTRPATAAPHVYSTFRSGWLGTSRLA